MHGVISWAVTALGSAIIGVMVGGAIAVAVHQLGRR